MKPFRLVQNQAGFDIFQGEVLMGIVFSASFGQETISHFNRMYPTGRPNLEGSFCPQCNGAMRVEEHQNGNLVSIKCQVCNGKRVIP